MSTLKTIIRSFHTVYIVFDALDECPERSRILIVLREVHGWKLDTLHLLATSRKEGDISKALTGLVSQEVSMDESLVDHDIQGYVSRRVDIEFSMCPAEEKEMVKSTLMKDAHGMFRLVKCQLDVLANCQSASALEEALTHLPKTLYETYDRILEAINEVNRQDALRLLKWLAFSVDTLSTEEALDVIATDPDAKKGPLFDCRRRPWGGPQGILYICSSLVTITSREDSSNVASIGCRDGRVLVPKTGMIRLAHFSVREYLISEHLWMSTTALSCYYFDEKVAHVSIAKTCLAYLLQF
ncbi:hypothetical protein JB92DRAFT_2694798, partial [Gautieria morchelliformis]